MLFLLASLTLTYLDVPVLAQRSDDALLNRPVAGAADRYAHLVVTAQTVQLVL